MGPKAAAAILALLLLTALSLQAAEFRHRDIWLKNEQGERITPGRNAADAYSPRKTCGTCHGYGTITSGYHFQQGFDEMRDGFDPRRPWVLSPGRFGSGCVPGSLSGRVAAKGAPPAGEETLSTFDWIGAGGKFGSDGKPISEACGWTHPGGGPLEYGRKSDGRPDPSKTLSEGEAQSRTPRDGDYLSRSTPDRRSQFRKTGVVEGDCLLCHLPGYRMDRRNAQLIRRNYRWAATAGAGLGEISGALFTFADPQAGPGSEAFGAGTWNLSQSPVVAYHWKNADLFTKQGQLRGRLIRKGVDSKGCLQCHRQMDARKTGTLYEAAYDVHIAAGLRCTDCHPLAGSGKAQRLRHQIAKGYSPQATVRDGLDGVGMKTCVRCHIEGQYRKSRPEMPREPPNPAKTHREKFPQASFHFALLHCSACHATAQPGRAIYLQDAATGEEIFYTADRLEKADAREDWGEPAVESWRPWMVRFERVKGEGERYIPAVTRSSQWFGERLRNGVIRPIDLSAVRRAFRSVKGLSTVEVRTIRGLKVQTPTVATEADMRSMIRALTILGFSDVVFVADRVYALQGDKAVPMEAPPEALGRSFPAYDTGAAWFGERQADGGIAPIAIQDLLAAFRSLEGITMAETRGPQGKLAAAPMVATVRDIRRAIDSLNKMGFKDVVFLDDRLFELDRDQLRSRELPRGLRPPLDGRGKAASRWFGERRADGSVRPIGPAAVRQALNGLAGLSMIEVRNERGVPLLAPTIATEADIGKLLTALTKAGFKRVVMVGKRLYELRNGKLSVADIVRADPPPAFAIHHNVLPLERKRTYGAKGSPEGCLDCHSDRAPFFTKMKILNPGRFLAENYPTPKAPNAAPQMHGWGLQDVPAHE